MADRPLRPSDGLANIFRFGFGFPVTPIKSADYIMLPGDFLAAMNTGAVRAVQLPPIEPGRVCAVKDASGAGAGSNNITVTDQNGLLIDGNAASVIAKDRGARWFIANDAATAWYVLADIVIDT